MASIGLPPPPINDSPGSFTWLEWYRQLRSYISTSGSVPWYVINFAGSNINDLQERDHNQLQNLQGGKVDERYHLTAAQAAALTAGDHNTLDGLQGGLINERFHMTENSYDAVNRMSWNNIDGTVDIDMGLGPVTQQVGLETFIKAQNITGVTIPEGSVVSYDFSATPNVTVEPFIADGTIPQGAVFGVTTMNILNNGFGYVTTLGEVRGLNTAALPAGAVLFASPTVAGGYTDVRPLPPNVAVPIGIITVSDAINGSIFVRPIVTTTQSYGIFYNTTTISLTADTPTATTFNTNAGSNGIVIGSPTSRIVVNRPGSYNFAFALQLDSSSSSNQTLTIWIRKNGVNVPYSATDITISSNSAIEAPAWGFDLIMIPGDYFELVVAASSSSLSLAAKPAQTVPFIRPEVASVYLTVTQIY